MTSKAKRLAPTSDTVRQLYLKSGNLCAFPSCSSLMMNAEGAFIGQLCHIEAAEDGGERFNAAMTNDERRAPENLMLMCYPHHVITNDVAKYDVTKLRQYKAEHEARFSSPDRAILGTLKDWTTVEDAKPPQNLAKANRVLGWGNTPDELTETARTLATYVGRLSRVPVGVRNFLGKVAERAHRLGNALGTGRSPRGLLVACYDIEKAFRLTQSELNRQIVELGLYNLGGLDDLEIGGRKVPAVLVSDLDGWSFWLQLARFCESEAVSMETFSELLDFSPLDN